MSKSYSFSLLFMTYSSSSLMNAKSCCIFLNIFFGTVLMASILQIDSDFGKSMFENFTNASESNKFWKNISSKNHLLLVFSKIIRLCTYLEVTDSFFFTSSGIHFSFENFLDFSNFFHFCQNGNVKWSIKFKSTINDSSMSNFFQ